MCSLYNIIIIIIKLIIVVIYSCHSLKNCSNYSNMKTHIDICPSPLTKNVCAILIQNEDLNALQTTGTMNHTFSDIMSV